VGDADMAGDGHGTAGLVECGRVAGGVAGVGVAFKMGMARFRSRLTGKPVADQDSSTEDESGSAHD
jgi:hypothetical protein